MGIWVCPVKNRQPTHIHHKLWFHRNNKTTKNYSIFELELNAFAWALQKHFYINGAQTQIECFTDHKSLANIENKDFAEVTNNSELKLLESITPYNIKLRHIPADKNTFADALSRLPSKSDTTPPPYIERYTQIKVKPHPKQAKISVIRASGHESLDLSTVKLKQTAAKDPEYKNLIQTLRTYKNPKHIPAQYPEKGKKCQSRKPNVETS